MMRIVLCLVAAFFGAAVAARDGRQLMQTCGLTDTDDNYMSNTIASPYPNGDPTVGACGGWPLPSTTAYYCAIEASVFSTYTCGQCIEVSYGGKSVTVQVLDKCKDCYLAGQLHLSSAAFSVLSQQPGNLHGVSWKIVACPYDYNWHGRVKVAVDKGATLFSAAYAFDDLPYPVLTAKPVFSLFKTVSTTDSPGYFLFKTNTREYNLPQSIDLVLKNGDTCTVTAHIPAPLSGPTTERVEYYASLSYYKKCGT